MVRGGVPGHGCAAGGEWKKRMRGTDGKDYWRSGRFVEVVEPEWLVFTYVSDDPAADPAHETMVTVRFDETADGRTRLTLSQAVFESVASRDSHRTGWTSAVERFGEYLAVVVSDAGRSDRT